MCYFKMIKKFTFNDYYYKLIINKINKEKINMNKKIIK